MVQLLLENDADVTAQNKDGWTALHFAVSRYEAQIVKLLVDKNPGIVSLKDVEGNTALDWAREMDNVEY